MSPHPSAGTGSPSSQEETKHFLGFQSPEEGAQPRVGRCRSLVVSAGLRGVGLVWILRLHPILHPTLGSRSCPAPGTAALGELSFLGQLRVAGAANCGFLRCRARGRDSSGAGLRGTAVRGTGHGGAQPPTPLQLTPKRGSWHPSPPWQQYREGWGEKRFLCSPSKNKGREGGSSAVQDVLGLAGPCWALLCPSAGGWSWGLPKAQGEERGARAWSRRGLVDGWVPSQPWVRHSPRAETPNAVPGAQAPSAPSSLPALPSREELLWDLGTSSEWCPGRGLPLAPEQVPGLPSRFGLLHSSGQFRVPWKQARSAKTGKGPYKHHSKCCSVRTLRENSHR
ncbi:uncharacterized protein LOC127481552 [Manacus candei]|uniref:uncharacterized protein LOC127481552 n=1 Tax=Manacus candei TaxID=415023 RepID=UPI0022261893|nr:uncharacterized protein LOC127481552 [Manacus candei]